MHAAKATELRMCEQLHENGMRLASKKTIDPYNSSNRYWLTRAVALIGNTCAARSVQFRIPVFKADFCSRFFHFWPLQVRWHLQSW